MERLKAVIITAVVAEVVIVVIGGGGGGGKKGERERGESGQRSGRGLRQETFNIILSF